MKKYTLKINGKSYEVEIKSFDVTKATVNVNGTSYDVEISYPESETPVVPRITRKPVKKSSAKPAAAPQAAPSGGGKSVKAPMPGLILKVLVKPGDQVSKGQKVMVMEAMKMENDINTAVAGTVKEVKVSEGDNVQEGDVLVVIE